MKPDKEAIVFDAYGTLFDVHCVIAHCNQTPPSPFKLDYRGRPGIGGAVRREIMQAVGNHSS
jgi:hypothetical protein